MKQTNRQFDALEQLYIKLNGTTPNINGESIYLQLRKIEKKLTKLHEKACDIPVAEITIDKAHDIATLEIKRIFNVVPKGLYINTDPRGYALKIDDEVFKSNYQGISLETDWGGYGLLAPDLN